MALLTSCWFIIESVLIPHGFRKWFCLSFFINPFFLIFCQIFLWAKQLQEWVFVVLWLPFNVISFVGRYVFRVLKILWVRFFTIITRSRSIETVEDGEKSGNQIVVSYSFVSVAPVKHDLRAFELHADNLKVFQLPKNNLQVIDFYGNESEEDEDYMEATTLEEPNLYEGDDLSTDDHFLSSCGSNSPISDSEVIAKQEDEESDLIYGDYNNDSPILEREASDEHDEEVSNLFYEGYSSNFAIIEREGGDESNRFTENYGSNLSINEREVIEIDNEESDPFYKKYSERMRWFDALNYERTFGISAVLESQLGTPTPFDNMMLSNMDKKRLLRSLESELEMVYVAQSCLSWEALHHQYKKVETLASSENGVFYDNAAGKFQKFQVLLERFMEDERTNEGKRFWGFVKGRFSTKSLLQVPLVSGYMDEEKEGKKGEAMRAREVLKAIEKCIRAFWEFVKTDNKKSWWRPKSLLWSYPPVEDPRDMHLLNDLHRTLYKKEIWLKDMQGKNKCWLNRSRNQSGEPRNGEILITMIEMKLVSRVLKMNNISSAQLKWCHEKLSSIEFKEGKVIRESNNPLFPLS